ncbi:putative helicase [Dissulfuribacter thermophilus]|uniref:Putative helicase n=1 Tax=Dissulfuribacter thermophilus TaxID=1156395 RepID=A0A1B9F4U9_9BACT|nr:putative helicase [Dissulfuribacter thermophilus]
MERGQERPQAATVLEKEFLLSQLRQNRALLRDVEKCGEILEELISSKDSLSEDELMFVVNACFEVEKVADALELLDYMHERFPESVRAWKDHIDALILLGKQKEALSILAKAKRCVKDYFWAETKGKEISLEGEVIEPESQDLQASHSSHISFEKEQNDPDELEPFFQVRKRNEDLRRYLEIFSGRQDVFARQWVDRKEGRTGYVPERRPMTIEDVSDHVNGKATYGIYLMRQDNTVKLGVIDIDLRKDYRGKKVKKDEMRAVKKEAGFLLRRLNQVSSDYGLSCIVEFSGGKGYHLWYPVDNPVSASSMRKVLLAIVNECAKGLEFFELEVFPKQDRLTGKGLGNLVKLPLGIHRGTGKRSFFLSAGAKDQDRQFALLQSFKFNEADLIDSLSTTFDSAKVVVHPALKTVMDGFPELMELEAGCRVISRIVKEAMSGGELSERERKILIGTIGHLPKGRLCLHTILSKSSGYNRHLLDFEVSRLRWTPLGCKRIHSLYGLGEGGLDCTFSLKNGQYAHPLLHISDWDQMNKGPKSERIEDLRDAIVNLKTAIEVLERYL